MLLMWGVEEKVRDGDNEGQRDLGNSITTLQNILCKGGASSYHNSKRDCLLLARSGFSAGAMFVRTANAASSAFWADVAAVAQISSQVMLVSRTVVDLALTLSIIAPALAVAADHAGLWAGDALEFWSVPGARPGARPC